MFAIYRFLACRVFAAQLGCLHVCSDVCKPVRFFCLFDCLFMSLLFDLFASYFFGLFLSEWLINDWCCVRLLVYSFVCLIDWLISWLFVCWF